jgi:hypothetical protein
MDFYLLAVSGVSTLCLCGGEAKRILVALVGPNRRVFRGYRAHPTHTESEEKGYENHPTTVYSTRTRDRHTKMASLKAYEQQQQHMMFLDLPLHIESADAKHGLIYQPTARSSAV